MASEMVMAYGDNGMELVPASEVVEIRPFPIGVGNIVIPASNRFLNERRGGGVPTRLLSIRRPSTTRNPRPFPLVEYECTPYARWDGDASPRTVSACYLQGERDAGDPLFRNLPASDLQRLRRAVAAITIRQDADQLRREVRR